MIHRTTHTSTHYAGDQLSIPTVRALPIPSGFRLDSAWNQIGTSNIPNKCRTNLVGSLLVQYLLCLFFGNLVRTSVLETVELPRSTVVTQCLGNRGASKEYELSSVDGDDDDTTRIETS